MIRGARFVHTNLVARDWKSLAAFYEKVFGAVPVPPQRNYFGAEIERVTGLANPRVQGIHLQLPGFDGKGPTLEIFEYAEPHDRGPSKINQPGFAHIAFEVDSVDQGIQEFVENGGSALGEKTTLTIANGARVTLVYLRDPEGNIVELQSWEY